MWEILFYAIQLPLVAFMKMDLFYNAVWKPGVNRRAYVHGERDASDEAGADQQVVTAMRQRPAQHAIAADRIIFSDGRGTGVFHPLRLLVVRDFDVLAERVHRRARPLRGDPLQLLDLRVRHAAAPFDRRNRQGRLWLRLVLRVQLLRELFELRVDGSSQALLQEVGLVANDA